MSFVLGFLLLGCRSDQIGGSEDTGRGEDTGSGEELLPACEFAWEWRVDRVTSDQWPSIVDIAVDADANVYAVANLYTQSPASPFEAWLSKWGPDGSLLWTRTILAPEFDESVSAMALGPAGELYLAGAVRVGGNWAPWLAEFDPSDGTERWSQTFEGTAGWTGGRVADLTLAPSGQLITTGVFWIAAHSPSDGSLIWTTVTPQEDALAGLLVRFNRVVATPSGELRVLGSWSTFSYPSPTGEVLLRFDPSGELLDLSSSEADSDIDRRTWLLDRSDDLYYDLRNPDPRNADGTNPSRLERRSVDGELLWSIDESAWNSSTIGLLNLADDGMLDLVGHVGTRELWTARVSPTGELSPGCRHVVTDPDNQTILRQSIDGVASGPNGGLALSGVHYRDGADWAWVGYLAPQHQ